MPRRWTILDDQKQQAVLEDLREIISSGILNFVLAELRFLPFLFGEPERAATKSEIQQRLFDYLMMYEPGKDPIRDAATLSDQTRFRLTIFRGTKESVHLNVNDARESASEMIGRRMSADGVRKEGGLEYQLVLQLTDMILSEPRRHSTPASAEGDTLVRAFGVPYESSSAAAEVMLLAHDLHIEPTAAERDIAFWWRTSTKAHIAEVAGLPRVTIYLGGDGSCDIGPPLNRELFATLMRNRLLDTSSAAPDEVHAIVDAVVASCPEPYLGSIVRELYRSRAREVSVHSETQLYYDIQRHTAAARSSGGFVARAVILLAFTLRLHGRVVEIISAHYDSDLESAERNRRYHFPHLRSISLHDCLDRAPPEELMPETVPLLRVSGRHGDRSTQGLVVGEADFLADEHLDSAGHGAEHVSRYRILERALTSGAVLFVGTSLGDPGVLAALAATRHAPWPRYALVLPPTGLAPATLSGDATAGALRLLSMRYLHLGVVPVIGDFDHQIPQFLREVALKVRMGAGYAGYDKRMELWWRRWAELFGYDERGARSGSPDGELLGLWQRRLRALAATIAGPKVLGQDRRAKETIRIEVWLRNHHRRCLFLWASSPDAPSEAAPTEIAVHADDRNDIAPLAFRTGRTVHQQLLGKSWQYGVSTNIVLFAAPWHRLPVGVVNVLSSRNDAALAALASDVDALRAFERELLQRVKELLRDYEEEEDDGDSREAGPP